VIQSERSSAGWAKSEGNPAVAIEEAELLAPRFDLQCLDAEFAAGEGDVDAEIREIEMECGEFGVEVQRLEFQLSDVKEQRKQSF
jgi:hypothetical protein